MNKITCHYVVKARTAVQNVETGEVEFRVIDGKKFEDPNPILAREAAFKFRNEFVYGILSLGQGLSDEEIGWNPDTSQIEKLSDREIRRLINPFLEQGSVDEEINDLEFSLQNEDATHKEPEWKTPDDTFSWYPKYNTGIWVIFNHNDDEFHDIDADDLVIDKICRYEGLLPVPPNYMNLIEEVEFYDKHHYDTKRYKTTVSFFDDESYMEGGDDEQQALKKFTILKTPFDWSGYNKINWWETSTDEELQDSKKDTHQNLLPPMEVAFLKGESEYSEFKPGLINRPNSKRNIELEVASTIAAFMNSKGGYVFIGVADKNGEIIGLDFSKISQDEFLRHFTRIKSHYLPKSIAYSTYGEFYIRDYREIFVVTVFPSVSEPVYVWNRDENNKIVKEFYVRADNSTRHVYDIEDVVKYCRKRWK